MLLNLNMNPICLLLMLLAVTSRADDQSDADDYNYDDIIHNQDKRGIDTGYATYENNYAPPEYDAQAAHAAQIQAQAEAAAAYGYGGAYGYGPSAGGGHLIAQHVEVQKPVPIPVFKALPVPVPQPVPVAVPHPVPIHIPQPIPVQVPVPVPVVKTIAYPVEKPVPYPVEKPVTVTVEKKVPYPVPKPYYIYKSIRVEKNSLHRLLDSFDSFVRYAILYNPDSS